jgi:hypothetical protein
MLLKTFDVAFLLSVYFPSFRVVAQISSILLTQTILMPSKVSYATDWLPMRDHNMLSTADA